MRRAGKAVRTTQGLVILRAPPDTVPRPVDRDDPDLGDLPAIGDEVVDSSLTSVGRVVDVFGPVERPYLAVTPDRRAPASVLGERLYVRDRGEP
jgi:RNA-binding protein